MYRVPERYGFVYCAVCDDVTSSAKDPPVCHDCIYLMSRGRMKPGAVNRSVRDALGALKACRFHLGRAGPPTTGERVAWCLDYCRARGAYLRRHNGTLPPVGSVPHTDPGQLRDTLRARKLRIHSRGSSQAPGP